MVEKFFRPSPERRQGGSFKLVVDRLYRAEGSDVATGFTFDASAITEALRNIYEKNFNTMTDIESRLFFEFWDKLNFATNIGLSQSGVNIEDEFRHALRYNNAVFAAFKTHRMQNDMAALLLDSNGVRKPFKEWIQEVKPIADHQVYSWFKTEYVTAINRATHAANRKQFMSISDILPNLEWRPSTAADPREMHRLFYGLILPIEHPFWREHSPGDDWNCQCRLSATDAERTPEDKIPITLRKAAEGLDNNPAEDGKLFSDSHPYFPSSCNSCKLNPSRNRPMAFAYWKERDCYKCKTAQELVSKAIRNAAKKNIEELKKKIDVYNGYTIPKPDAPRGNIIFLHSSFKRIIQHGGNCDEIQRLLANIRFEDINDWRYIGSAPHSRNHPESENVNYYEFTYNERIYYAVTLAHKRYNGDVVHTIKLKEPDDIIK